MMASHDQFQAYLTQNGVKSSTLKRLQDEDIGNMSTLKALSNHDFEHLGLTVGQTAILRQLATDDDTDIKGHQLSRKARLSSSGRQESYSEAADEYVELKSAAAANRFHIKESVPEAYGKNQVTLRRKPNGHMSNTDPDEMAAVPPKMRAESTRKLSIDNSGNHELELKITCLKTGNKGKIVAELTTQHQEEITPLPTRILLLCDISGSMGIKTGKRRRYSKLNHLKRFVMSMVGALDNGDHAALVTFGEKAEVILPLTEITEATRDRLKAKVEELDKSYLSTKTNLSGGLSTALDVFGRASSSEADLLNYRNMIIVCSDGEINLGTQETGKLIHEVREKIRSMARGLDDTQNQWVSISTIATGSESTDMLYSLSKFCSSDAFYHIDTDNSNLDPEVDLFLPVMLRKVAVAWNVSFHAECSNGAYLINSECTQDNKVRIRKQISQQGEKTEKAYFYYDIPAASTKHIGLVLDLEDLPSTSDPNIVILTITVVFTGISQKRRSVKRDITLGEVFNPNKKEHKEALEASYMHEARIVSQMALHSAAENVKGGDARQSRIDIVEGKSELQKLMEKYGQIAQEEEVNLDIITYAGSLMKNMESLLDCLGATPGIDDDDDTEANGKSWMKIKAVSSAITREAPTLSETVKDNDLLCPLPDVAHVHSPLIREQMERVYKKQGVRRTRFEQFDDVVDELSKSLKKYNMRR